MKVVQALIGVVQWIMERGAALMDFVGTVIDAVSDIANGGVGGVPAKIEAALGKAVPLVIAFLANLLGLGGISDKIKSILKAVQAPINKALDFVIKGALKLAGPLIKGVKGIGAKVKAKVLGGDDSPEGKKKRLDKGMASGVSAANRLAGRRVGEKVLKPMLSLIGKRYGLSVLEPVPDSGRWAVHGEVQRAKAPTLLPTDPAAATGDSATKPQIRTPRAMLYQGGSGATLDNAMLTRAVTYRNGTPLSEESFGSNFAVFKVRSGSNIIYLESANDPGSLHSEEKIIGDLVARFGMTWYLKGVTVLQVYTERRPCGNCGPQLQELARKQGAPISIYHTIMSTTYRNKARELMNQYVVTTK